MRRGRNALDRLLRRQTQRRRHSHRAVRNLPQSRAGQQSACCRMREDTGAIVFPRGDARTAMHTFGQSEGWRPSPNVCQSRGDVRSRRDQIPCMEDIMGFLPEKKLSDKCRGAWFAAVVAALKVRAVLLA